MYKSQSASFLKPILVHSGSTPNTPVIVPIWTTVTRNDNDYDEHDQTTYISQSQWIKIQQESQQPKSSNADADAGRGIISNEPPPLDLDTITSNVSNDDHHHQNDKMSEVSSHPISIQGKMLSFQGQQQQQQQYQQTLSPLIESSMSCLSFPSAPDLNNKDGSWKDKQPKEFDQVFIQGKVNEYQDLLQEAKEYIQPQSTIISRLQETRLQETRRQQQQSYNGNGKTREKWATLKQRLSPRQGLSNKGPFYQHQESTFQHQSFLSPTITPAVDLNQDQKYCQCCFL
jgi:hypothetical protein